MKEINLPERLHEFLAKEGAHGVKIEWQGPGERHDTAIFDADGVKCWCADYYEHEGLLRDDVIWQDADDALFADGDKFYAEFGAQPLVKLTDEEWDMLRRGSVPQYPYRCETGEIPQSSAECRRIEDIIAIAKEIATFRDAGMVVGVDADTGNVRLRVPMRVWLLDVDGEIVREVAPKDLGL